MLRVHGAAALTGRRLDDRNRFRNVSWRAERWQPTVADSTNATEFARGDASKPNIELRLCGTRQYLNIVNGEELSVVGNDLARPAGSHEGECFVMASTTFAALDAERTLLGWVNRAESHRRKKASSGKHIEGCHLFCQNHWVATREDQHRRSQLHSRSPAGSDSQRDHGVGRLGANSLRHPEGIEPECFASINDCVESIRVCSPGQSAEADPNSYFHGAAHSLILAPLS